MRAEILILNYNGKHLLRQCLPSVMGASQRSPILCSVTVVDNCSTDDSVEFVRREFPGVKVFIPQKNLVLCSFNDAVRESRADLLILLNNDLQVHEDFVKPLVEIFQSHPDAFFSAPKVLNYETGQQEGAISKMEFRWGLLWGSMSPNGSGKKMHGYTMQCGMGAFRRDRFIELGGYDDLYLPGTVEDSDLCFRGWQHGWKGYYCPDSVIHHMGQTSFKRAFGSGGIRRLNRRNLYLFVWKNVRSPVLLAQHFLLLPLQLLKYCLFGQFDFLKGFAEAVALLPRALDRRRRAKTEKRILSDRDVFAISRTL